jgi:hypothetical protein
MRRGRHNGGLLGEFSEGRAGEGGGHTACTSWVLWSKVCKVVDRVVDY